jgi:hypothetical protein
MSKTVTDRNKEKQKIIETDKLNLMNHSPFSFGGLFFGQKRGYRL